MTKPEPQPQEQLAKENNAVESDSPTQSAAPQPPVSFKIKPLAADQSQKKKPSLPKLATPNNSDPHGGDDSTPKMSLQQNLEVELQQLLQQIEELYQEGPIVDGWLETNSDQSFGADYRLCGQDENGQFWFRPCPADQLPSVSMAIFRYQKLRQLLQRKEDLENRLSQ